MAYIADFAISSSNASDLSMNGSAFGGGDWNVNVAGSGRSQQSATSAAIPGNLLLWAGIALAGVAVWYVLKK